jgi:hypothetical protein
MLQTSLVAQRVGKTEGAECSNIARPAFQNWDGLGVDSQDHAISVPYQGSLRVLGGRVCGVVGDTARHMNRSRTIRLWSSIQHMPHTSRHEDKLATCRRWHTFLGSFCSRCAARGLTGVMWVLELAWWLRNVTASSTRPLEHRAKVFTAARCRDAILDCSTGDAAALQEKQRHIPINHHIAYDSR